MLLDNRRCMSRHFVRKRQGEPCSSSQQLKMKFMTSSLFSASGRPRICNAVTPQ